MSKFVSGGSLDAPAERSEEWVRAQRELEEERERKRKTEIGKQEGGKSLYEVLQANQAKKQEAFEEAAKLKNQFRSLDQDEIDFIDSVRESERAKEQAVRKETSEQVASFRRLQENVERHSRIDDTAPTNLEETLEWAVGRKRRRGEKEALRGIKRRKSSSEAKPVDLNQVEKEAPDESKDEAPKPHLPPESKPPKGGLGLVAYDSDDDE